jgi:hypothetical protein
MQNKVKMPTIKHRQHAIGCGTGQVMYTHAPAKKQMAPSKQQSLSQSMSKSIFLMVFWD